MKKLAIVVPYRDRETHLRQFVPHMQAYFSRDKVDRDIPYRAIVVEQAPGLPFNAGALKNIGFQLAREASDYTCFNDVDYLPVWADYSWAETPTVGLYYGAEVRPVRVERTDLGVRHNVDRLAGGMLLVPNEMFTRVNGYPNVYWGWGQEDVELQRRFEAAGIPYERRKGTFRPLPHDSAAFNADVTPSPISLVNQRLYDDRHRPGVGPVSDGLSDLAFEILARKNLPVNPKERDASWEMVTVRLDMRPSPEQEDALKGR